MPFPKTLSLLLSSALSPGTAAAAHTLLPHCLSWERGWHTPVGDAGGMAGGREVCGNPVRRQKCLSCTSCLPCEDEDVKWGPANCLTYKGGWEPQTDLATVSTRGMLSATKYSAGCGVCQRQ